MKLKKFIKILCVILCIIILNTLLIINSVKAIEIGAKKGENFLGYIETIYMH